MAHGFKKLNKKAVVLIALCLCLVVGTVGGVWAYLSAKTNTLQNTFVPAYVTCSVEETFQDGVKSDVTVRNTGNVDAFIRATVVATFQSNDGKVLATAPKEGVDYTVSFNLDGWKKGSDGFWYHTTAVSPNALTAVLINSATSVTSPDGYKLNLQIIATAIQSDPATAAQEAWGVNVNNGQITPN